MSLNDLKKDQLVQLAKDADVELPTNLIAVKKDWLAVQILENAATLGWNDGQADKGNRNPFDHWLEAESSAFEEYEDEFATALAEREQEAEEVQKEKAMNVSDLMDKKPTEMTEDEQAFMRKEGYGFTSAGWTVIPKMPKSAKHREKRAGRGRVAPIVETGLRNGLSDEEILANVRKANPEAKTSSGCIAWYASKLRNRGVKLPNRERKPRTAKKADETQAS